MKLLLSAVVILSFVCVGHTAPSVSCESLTQKIPIENIDQLLGKWMFVGETANIGGLQMLTKRYVDSAYVNVTSLPESNSLNIFHTQKSFGQCLSYTTTVLVSDNSLRFTYPYRASEVLLTTSCPDCWVIKSNFTFGSTFYEGLQLLSRRRVLTTAELEEFKKQAECLNLPAPAILDPEKELCSADQATSSTDITAMLNSDIATQIFGIIDSAIQSQGGLTGLFNSVIENLPAAKN